MDYPQSDFSPESEAFPHLILSPRSDLQLQEKSRSDRNPDSCIDRPGAGETGRSQRDPRVGRLSPLSAGLSLMLVPAGNPAALCATPQACPGNRDAPPPP